MDQPTSTVMWVVCLLCVIITEKPAGGIGIPDGLCKRIIVDVDPQYVGYVQLGGAYSLQNFTWFDFPVFKHEQQIMYFYYDRTSRRMLIGRNKGELFGLGATTVDFSDSNWLPRYSIYPPFRNVIDKWLYKDYVTGGLFYVDPNADLGPRCIPDDVQFRQCSSAVFKFNDVIIQDQNDRQLIYINQLKYYYEQLLGIYRNARPVFERKESINPAYLFYSPSVSGWVVGPDYNSDSVFMYVSSTSMRPEFITGTWYVYTNSRFQAKSDVSLNCSGTPTNRTCAVYNPCQNSGTCLQKDSTDVFCICTLNFTGRHCEKPRLEICPSLRTVTTNIVVWDTLYDGAIATWFCGQGYTPSYYFAVCQVNEGSTNTGKWVAYDSCTKTTIPPITTARSDNGGSSWSSWSGWSSWSSLITTARSDNGGSSWSSWSGWNSWSSWSNTDGDDSSSSSNYVEPEGLWIFTLVLTITVNIILPFVIFVILKYKEEPDEAEREVSFELTRVAPAEPGQGQNQYTGEESAVAPPTTAEGVHTEAGNKNGNRSSRIKNISFIRILSITCFISFWFYLPWTVGCFETKCGFYSSSILTLALFGIFMMPFSYILMLAESFRARERSYLRKLGKACSVGRFVSQVRQAQPIITWRAVCYHYETRTRVVYYTDGQGNSQSRQETYTETVVTHRDFKTFLFNYWTDESAPTIEGVGTSGVTRIRLDKTVTPGDLETLSEYMSGFEEFKRRNEGRDTFMDASEDMGVPGFEKRVAAFVGENTAPPWWMKMPYYWLAVLLGVTWPYRWYFIAKTGKTYYTIIKKFYVTRPEVDSEDIRPYDTEVGETSEREIRKSIAVVGNESEGSQSGSSTGLAHIEPSDQAGTTSIAVDAGGPTVRVAL